MCESIVCLKETLTGQSSRTNADVKRKVMDKSIRTPSRLWSIARLQLKKNPVVFNNNLCHRFAPFLFNWKVHSIETSIVLKKENNTKVHLNFNNKRETSTCPVNTTLYFIFPRAI